MADDVDERYNQAILNADPSQLNDQELDHRLALAQGKKSTFLGSLAGNIGSKTGESGANAIIESEKNLRSSVALPEETAAPMRKAMRQSLPLMGMIGGGLVGGIPGAGAGGFLGKASENFADVSEGVQKTPGELIKEPLKEGAASMFAEMGGKAASKGLEMAASAAKPYIEPVLTKVASSLSSTPEMVLKHYNNNKDRVNALLEEHAGNVSDLADSVRDKIMGSVDNFRKQQNSEIGKGLEKYSDHRLSLQPVIDALEEAKGKENEKLFPEVSKNIDTELEKIRSLSEDGTVSPKEMLDVQKLLRSKTSYSPDGNFFTYSSPEGRAFKKAAAETKQAIDKVAPEVKGANGKLAALHDLEDDMNMNLVTSGKSDSGLKAAGAGSNERNLNNLQKLDELTGSNAVEHAKDLAAANYMNNPALLSNSHTGKSLLPYVLGKALGGRPGEITAGMLASPMVQKGLMNQGPQTRDMLIRAYLQNKLDK